MVNKITSKLINLFFSKKKMAKLNNLNQYNPMNNLEYSTYLRPYDMIYQPGYIDHHKTQTYPMEFTNFRMNSKNYFYLERRLYEYEVLYF